MQIFKKLLILGLVFFASAASYFVFASDFSESSGDFYSTEKNGQVLGVSEEFEDDGQETKPKIALAKDELKNFLPIIPKADLAPTKDEDAGRPGHGAGSFAVMDVASMEILYGKEENTERSIASLTKLATALVLMDMNLDWEAYYEIKGSDRVNGGRIYVYQGEEIRLRDLLFASLVASANTSTKALVSATGLSEEEFVVKMNEKAAELGLEKTKFADPVGLSSWNISSAHEVSLLLKHALDNPTIRDCMSQQSYVFYTKDGKSKTVKSTNILLDDYSDGRTNILAGKTGFTGAAGYCFASMFENRDKKKIVAVALGTHTHSDRFSDVRQVADWTFSSFKWNY